MARVLGHFAVPGYTGTGTGTGAGAGSGTGTGTGTVTVTVTVTVGVITIIIPTNNFLVGKKIIKNVEKNSGKKKWG